MTDSFSDQILCNRCTCEYELCQCKKSICVNCKDPWHYCLCEQAIAICNACRMDFHLCECENTLLDFVCNQCYRRFSDCEDCPKAYCTCGFAYGTCKCSMPICSDIDDTYNDHSQISSEMESIEGSIEESIDSGSSLSDNDSGFGSLHEDFEDLPFNNVYYNDDEGYSTDELY